MRARSLTFLGAVIAVLLAFASPAGAAFAPDTTFDGDGAVTHDDSVVAQARGVATSGGLTYVAYADIDNDLHVLRLTSAGAPDPAWGGGDGVADVALEAVNSRSDILVLASGKVLVTGGATAAGMGLGVVRLTSTGAPDPTFSGDGKASITAANVTAGRYLATDANNRVYVAGNREQVFGPGDMASDFAVGRLTANGGRDNTFSGDGIAFVHQRRVDLLSDLAVDRSGRVLLMGESRANLFDLTGGVGAVARLRANGNLDPAYSGDGKMTFTFSGTSTVNGLGGGVDASNRVLFGVTTMNNKIGAVRVTATGVLDTSYSGDGRAVAPFTGFQSRDGASRVGSAMVFTGWGTDGDLWVGRLTATGAADTALGANGELLVDATANATDEAIAAAAGPSGSLVTAGYTANESQTSVLVTRLAPTP